MPLENHNNDLENSFPSSIDKGIDETKAEIAQDLSLTQPETMNFTTVNYDDVINHPSGDGEIMKQTLENILEPDNIRILSKEEFVTAYQSGQVDFSCIDGRSVCEDGKVIVHVAGDAYGLYVLAAMEMLKDLGIDPEMDDDIVAKYLTDNNIKPTSHSGSHSHGDDSITTCDCGHCKTNGMDLDDGLKAVANKYYENPVQLVGDHKEQAIIISPNTETLVLVNTTNELKAGDMENQAEHQVFWNDAGAIKNIMEIESFHYVQAIKEISGKDIDHLAIFEAWYNAYERQLGKTVQALKSSKPLADAGKLFVPVLKGDVLDIQAA